MPVSEGAQSILFAWGAIEQATANRASTAEVYQAIRDAATAQGMPAPSIPLRAVNELRSYAVAIRNASEALERADTSTALLSDYIAQAPWSRDLAAQNAAPELQVRFEQSFIDQAGGAFTQWRTLLISGAIPETIQSLYDHTEATAEALADEYGVTNAGIGAVQLIAR